jgi:dTMP kinase
VAYQGYGRRLDVEIIKSVNAWAMGDVTPDLVVYLKLDAQTACARVAGRGGTHDDPGHFEQEKIDFWQRVIDGYEKIFATRGNVLTLDATMSEEALVDAINL